ncbi:hypothetical protein FT663_04769 [Candidozyma haemuli var. vulneris]|uniref:Uncharacterized protein n=1 Tax=Candidozyma haemuli TaxID=45357 RepID=A0A2V1AZU3_9ASCO|nr:hypothetical protein CXQ85_003155 [[Candida] haemuloni]KAF3986696.1 hypothetical protein FT663_04769 [[Candida] haemuloni var. vulneris]KAF3986803.1 hypothetical protein FT662_04367 [[Candida] haemuloni var. vulneris]PVH23418.1 hypothetical protein CXQ85_003155 [[Candida] haemuloni]
MGFVHDISDSVQRHHAQVAEYGVLGYVGVFLVLVFSYWLYRTLKIFYLRKKFGAELAPWIPESGWFNSRPALEMFARKRDGNLVGWLWTIWNGDNENFRVRIGGDTLFVTTEPDNLRAVLATQFNDFALALRHSHFKPVLGDGVFTLDYSGWKHSRALLRPNFSREKVSHTQALEKHVQHLFRHVRKHQGNKFDLQEYFYRFTVDTSTEFLFGQSVYGLLDETIGEYRDEEFEGQFEFYEAFNRAQEILSTRAWMQKWYMFHNPMDFKRNTRIVHNFADYYVKKALNMSEEELEKASDGYIFLYELVKETRNPQMLRDQLLNIMIAGRDTTASLMTFSFFELSRNPEIFEKLKAEIREKFGSGESGNIGDITFETLKKCTYLKYFINEVLRLYPAVPINYRFANKHTTLPRGGGPNGDKPVFIEKGTCIGYLVCCTHRNEKYYGKDSHVFRPERWADRNLKPGWAYLPFNGGPRICLGQQFAITEASYVISRFMMEFDKIQDFYPEPERYPPRQVSQLTTTLATGCWISME